MSQVKQLAVLSAFLVIYCDSAPWSKDNNSNENDLNWHCIQLCSSNNGEVKFDSDTSTCYCKINSMKDSGTDWKCLTNNARLLGITLEIYESDKINRIKREANKIPTDLTSNTENTYVNITSTDSTLQLPLAIYKIRARLRLHGLKPLHVHKPVILRAANPNETTDRTPESLNELRKRIHERIAELRKRSKITSTLTP